MIISFVEFKIYISLKQYEENVIQETMFCRIQNLHISQTKEFKKGNLNSFIEFKIYISLKQLLHQECFLNRFIEFKIYISLKQQNLPKKFILVL